METKLLKYFISALIIFALWALYSVANASESDSLSAKNQEGEVFRIFPNRSCHVSEAPMNAKAAEYVSAKGEKVKGCFIESGGIFYFRFDDGDRGRAPAALFKPDLII